MDPGQIGLLVALILLVLFSAYFSATEMAFSTVNKVRLRTLEANGNRNAGKVLKMLDKYDRLLSTILVGNNIVNIASASLSTVFFTKLLLSNQELAVTLSTIVMTVAVLIFGEITPKTMAKTYSLGFTMKTWPVLKFFTWILFPIELLLIPWKLLINRIFKGKKKADAITEDELITYVETAQNEGGIDEHESRLIRSAIEFEDLDIDDIMVPRVNVEAIEENESLDVIADMFFDNGFSRMPVYSKTIDSIVGVIHEKDFYNLYCKPVAERPANIKNIIQNSICVSPSMKISTVLRMLQKAKMHMAIVVDEFGGTEGIVTLEDILEELVGDIWDEHDEVEILSKKVGADTYLVSGSQNLTDMFRELNMDVREEFDSTSVGGWVTERMGKIPATGEQMTYENLAITVLKANAKRVLELKIKVAPLSEERERGLSALLRRREKEEDGAEGETDSLAKDSEESVAFSESEHEAPSEAEEET